ncbi:MAG: polyphosphate kinase, partial [Pseudomonadales bacterium]|nr:polyphosphate kinase [Pseudomonadales bacterium]
MFEAVELGRSVSKEDYKKQEAEIRTQLLDVQGLLKEANFPVIIIVSGVEGAGKGEVVNRLNEWLDTRGVQTHAFWDETDEERERPHLWRFWRKLPPRGTIGIMFGSWYTRPIVDRVFNNVSAAGFDTELGRILELEKMLTQDGALIVKFWFHLSKKDQSLRLREDDKKFKKKKGESLEQRYAKHYQRFALVSENAIRQTDSGICPWYLIEASDKRFRDITVARTLTNAISQRLRDKEPSHKIEKINPPKTFISPSASLTILDQVDLSKELSRKEYQKQLNKYQNRLGKLTWHAREKGCSNIAVFEGWDAAGKGGAIRRITSAIDARLYRTISIAA